MPARRTEPTAWLIAPSARHATALEYVNAANTNLRQSFERWRAAHTPTSAQPPAPAPGILTLHRSTRT
jgi:3-mercaptopyruvate sulfurtransferase SseA